MTITLSKTEREILKQTYINYYPDDPKQQEFLDLLHNIFAIEYRNTKSWYDLHPLVIKQSIRKNLQILRQQLVLLHPIWWQRLRENFR